MEAMQQSTNVIDIKIKKTMPTPLSAQVKETIKQYFSQLDGHDTSGLYAMVICEIEKPLLEAVLEYCGYNQTKASKILGLSRSTLRKKIDHHGLS
jgi:Fis family transcriptional regulator